MQSHGLHAIGKRSTSKSVDCNLIDFPGFSLGLFSMAQCHTTFTLHNNNNNETSTKLLPSLHNNDNGTNDTLLLSLNNNKPSTMLLWERMQAHAHIIQRSFMVSLQLICIETACVTIFSYGSSTKASSPYFWAPLCNTSTLVTCPPP